MAISSTEQRFARKEDELCSLLRQTRQFDELEIRILNSMLMLRQKKQVKLTAAAIAKESGITVTNAYKYLYSLQVKGIVESSKEKNKLFWLTSSNPFPRLFSFAMKDFQKMKDLFANSKQIYEKLVPANNQPWLGEKVYEKYENNFAHRASYLFDLAHDEIIVSAPKFFEDVVLIDALSRAISRGVKVRFLAEEIDAKVTKQLREVGLEVRFGRSWPYAILVDELHGMTSDAENKGLWFLNTQNQFRQHFEQLWGKAQII